VAFLYIGHPVRTRAVTPRAVEPVVSDFADALGQGAADPSGNAH
jgi:hypothetical protein